jgi:hydrogenase 3 maturation protease
MHQVRALSPQRVLIVDAADMALAPGEIRLIDEDCVADHFLVTTHAIPLNFLIASLRETVPEIVFLGIQPKDIVFLGPVSAEIRQAVETLHEALVQGVALDRYGPIGDGAEGRDAFPA